MREGGRLDAAIASFNRAISLKPDYAEAYSNRGIALQECKQMEAAIACFDYAIALKPDYADAYWNKSLVLLLGGNFLDGWELYEWRWLRRAFRLSKPQFSKPLWLGNGSLEGKTILLHAEQGFGDTLQFCRYAKLVAALGARVLLSVPRPLMPLLKRLEGVDALLEEGGSPPAHDYHCPLMSLPLAFKSTLETIPAPSAYLYSDPDKVSRWADRLGGKTRPRVGLVWSGRPDHNNDHNRSLSLAELTAYLDDRFEYVSLQKEVRAADQRSLERAENLRHFGEELSDFADTAALCELMDVVVSVDTSVAHLSAGLGRATWVMLPHVPDWRWLLDRGDSPWYPSARLFRQAKGGDWERPLARMRSDLSALLVAAG